MLAGWFLLISFKIKIMADADGSAISFFRYFVQSQTMVYSRNVCRTFHVKTTNVEALLQKDSGDHKP